MQLYHFTSLENWESIRESKLKANTIHNGKQVIILTKQAERRQQLWAIDEHRGKTDIRITVNTLNWKELELPTEHSELHRLVQLGAVNAMGLNGEGEIFGLTGKTVDTSMYSEDTMNWCYARSCMFHDVKVWNEKSRKYAPVKLSPEEEILYLQEKIRKYYIKSDPYSDEKYFTDWYKIRWIPHYKDRIKELEDIVLSNKSMEYKSSLL